jgi:hypothetical protein
MLKSPVGCLKDLDNIIVQRHSDTRQSSKAAAANAILCQLEKVTAALEQLRDTREDAAVTVNGNEKLALVASLFFWPEVFSSIDRDSEMFSGHKNFCQAPNQLGTITDLIDNWKNQIVPKPSVMLKT